MAGRWAWIPGTQLAEPGWAKARDPVLQVAGYQLPSEE
jgi:hypothetical protein